MIIPVYKPIGISTHRLAIKAAQIWKEKATHTGSLDPMADGVVVVLTGPDRFEKERINDSLKVYQLKLLLGWTTDSDDLLGRPQFNDTEVSHNHITEYFESYLGHQAQPIHPFSAKRINGKSYFDIAKEGLTPPTHTSNVTLHSTSFIESGLIKSHELDMVIQSKINKIEGDFRQSKILSEWQQLLPSAPSTHQTVEYLFLTSKKFYVRSLVRQLNEELDISSTLLELTRLANGPHQIRDCVCLV